MGCADDLGLLTTADFSRIQDLCDQLEQAWKECDQSPGGPDLEQFLARVAAELRLAALYELVKTDMPLRLEKGLEWDLDFYVRRYPELGGHEQLSARLVSEEWLARKKHGLAVSPSTYQRRFPWQFPQLIKLVEKDGGAAMSGQGAPGGWRAAAWQAGGASLRASEPQAGSSTAGSFGGTIAPQAASASAQPAQQKSEPPVPSKVPAPRPISRAADTSQALSTASRPASTSRDRRRGGESGRFLARLRPGIAIRNLTLLRKLGEGSYADVWKVLDTEGGVEKAMRIIKTPARSEEAQAELKALASYKNLRHPFLLHTDSVFEEQHHLVIVMELVEGGSLRDRLKELRRAGEKGMSPFPLLGYIGEVAQVLDYLHGMNIIHRDIKPDNILLGKERYHVKVADLGLVKLTQTNAETSTLAGTPAYIAPEVWHEQGCFATSDQYSLAATYAELRQGEIASRGGVPCLKQGRLGPEEFKVIQMALAQDPEQRFRSCTALVKALETAVRADSKEPEPVLWPEWCQRAAPWVLLAITVLGLWAILGGDWDRASGRAGVEEIEQPTRVRPEVPDGKEALVTP
jgi:hypothetical protein